MVRISRRYFLLSLLTITSATATAKTRAPAADYIEYRDDVLALIEGVLGPGESIERIGKAVSTSGQATMLSTWSIAFLNSLLEGPTTLLQEDFVKRLRALYRKRVCLDFECGKITVIDGWVLSKTEAELSSALAEILA